MAWTRAPIRSACWRLHLIGGVDRTVFWGTFLSALLTSGIAWFANLTYLVPVVVLGAASTLELCRRATLEDPMSTRIWWRWVNEAPEVLAVGRFDCRSVGRRRLR
jgi:uncharacterized membrane protein